MLTAPATFAGRCRHN